MFVRAEAVPRSGTFHSIGRKFGIFHNVITKHEETHTAIDGKTGASLCRLSFGTSQSRRCHRLASSVATTKAVYLAKQDNAQMTDYVRAMAVRQLLHCKRRVL